MGCEICHPDLLFGEDLEPNAFQYDALNTCSDWRQEVPTKERWVNARTSMGLFYGDCLDRSSTALPSLLFCEAHMGEDMRKPGMKAPAPRPAGREDQSGPRRGPGRWALAGIVTLLLLGNAIPSSAARSEAPTGRTIAKRDGVPLYTEMASTRKVVKILRRGDVVTVDFASTTATGAWCYVTEVGRPGSAGYVQCEELEREPARRARHASPPARQAHPSAAPTAQLVLPGDATEVPPEKRAISHPVPMDRDGARSAEAEGLHGPKVAATLTLGALLAVGIVIAVSGRATYTTMVRARLQVREAWSGIDVQLRRLANVIPKWVEAVQAYAAHEPDAFEEVTRARSALEEAATAGEAARAKQWLMEALGRLFAVAEHSSQLRTSDSFLALKKELADTEEKLACASQLYNGTVLDYNARIQAVPALLLAQAAGFAPAALFEATEGARQEVRVTPAGGAHLGEAEAAPVAAEAGQPESRPPIAEDTVGAKDAGTESYFRLSGSLTPLYAMPEAAAPVRAELPAGTVVMLLGMDGNFLRVAMADSTVGYISSGAPIAWVRRFD